MTPKLSAESELLPALADFVLEEGIGVAVTDEADGAVRVETGPGGRECEVTVLHVGGWIACPVARAMASRLGIANLALGRILNHFGVKVKRCDLGCFA